MLNAFCRVAPSVLFNVLAIFLAGIFVFAIVFNPRTSVAVQARRFLAFLAIEKLQVCVNGELLTRRSDKRKAKSQLFADLLEAVQP